MDHGLAQRLARIERSLETIERYIVEERDELREQITQLEFSQRVTYRRGYSAGHHAGRTNPGRKAAAA